MVKDRTVLYLLIIKLLLRKSEACHRTVPPVALTQWPRGHVPHLTPCVHHLWLESWEDIVQVIVEIVYSVSGFLPTRLAGETVHDISCQLID